MSGCICLHSQSLKFARLERRVQEAQSSFQDPILDHFHICLRMPCLPLVRSGLQIFQWDDERSFWTITLCPTNSRNDTFQVEAEFLVSAAGGLSNPSFQKHSIQGLDEFEGAAMHTAKYDHSVSLSNKKVALVGSGCSAAQTLPVISKDPTCQIYNFSRSKSYSRSICCS